MSIQDIITSIANALTTVLGLLKKVVIGIAPEFADIILLVAAFILAYLFRREIIEKRFGWVLIALTIIFWIILKLV